LRDIPAVHRLTTDPSIARYQPLLGHEAVKALVQRVLDEVRAAGGRAPSLEALRERVLSRLAVAQTEGLVAVINGTGVLLHTNFGRAPISEDALREVARLGAGFTNLEYDLQTGERGSRYDRVASQLREVTGAQAVLLVNNCAAAVLLVLDTFARGREVVVSRGQLIEIGGGFRLPEVLAKSGATLVEVGTTNKTYARDFRDVWNQNTAIFMRSHQSNFRMKGFVAEVDSRTLTALAKELDVLSFEDLGSGAVVDLARFGLPHEPTLAEEIVAGFDLVAASGDKLLGGPQCGILAGRADLIEAMKRNPLLRALRVDKLTLAALSATLRAYLEPDHLEDIPLLRMLSRSDDELHTRAVSLCAEIKRRASHPRCSAIRTNSATGGGTLPDAELPSAGVAIEATDLGPDALAERLRRGTPPVVGRVEASRLIIDLRTVRPEEEPQLVDALVAAIKNRT
jgi:L-seryl-tRNA(Ser) seleniumtransferase